MKPITAVVLGAGSRGSTYSGYAKAFPEALEIIAVAEPREDRRNILAGEVFIRPNVRIIRRVCGCCMLVSLICLPAAFFYAPLIFFCIVMAFLCPVVNVVRYVFDAAVSIREENDLTI